MYIEFQIKNSNAIQHKELYTLKIDEIKAVETREHVKVCGREVWLYINHRAVEGEYDELMKILVDPPLAKDSEHFKVVKPKYPSGAQDMVGGVVTNDGVYRYADQVQIVTGGPPTMIGDLPDMENARRNPPELEQEADNCGIDESLLKAKEGGLMRDYQIGDILLTKEVVEFLKGNSARRVRSFRWGKPT